MKKSSAVVLKLNGKAMSFEELPGPLGKIMTSLDRSPADEIYTAKELAKRTGVGLWFFRANGLRSELDSYSVLVSQVRYWGNPKAIRKYKELAGVGQ